MSSLSPFKTLFVFIAFAGVSLAPYPAFAQRGGGGGGFHGGGGGFHGGGYSRSGRFSYGGGEYRGHGFEGGARLYGGGSHYARGGSEVGRYPASPRTQSSNIRPAINDGRWHSFGNSAHLNEGRSSAGLSHSTFIYNSGISNGAWHSFGGPSRAAFAFGGRGGFGRGWGRGGGWGGWCWGFGFGWPYWGSYWAFGWDPWWYSPYWYAPLAYPYYYSPYYYYDDSYDWSDNGPPYRPGYQVDDNSNLNGNLTSSANLGDAGSVQDSEQDAVPENAPPQPKPAPNSSPRAAQPETDSDRPTGGGQTTI